MPTRRHRSGRSATEDRSDPALFTGVSRSALPDFLGIGAQKAGTTWLFENLRRHPGLYLPRTKELHFFDRPRGRTLIDYAACFRAGAGRVCGEVTPAYGALTRTHIRFIASIMPDLRLILILRNPIDRSWSQAVMELASRRGRPIDSVPRREMLELFASEASTRRSGYVSMLDSWREHFAEEQLFVGFFEDIAERPRELLKTVFQHLGVTRRVD